MKITLPLTSLTAHASPSQVPAPGVTLGVLRYHLSVAQPTLLAATLSVSGDEARRATQLLLVDNATGEVGFKILMYGGLLSTWF